MQLRILWMWKTKRLFVNDVSLQEHCFYHGHVQGEADSSVSVGICSGIR